MRIFHLNATDYDDVMLGIRLFQRIQELENVHSSKYVADMFDLFDAVDITNICIANTINMIGSNMHQGVQYDPIEDIKLEVEENLLIGRDETETALIRRKNLGLYHMIIEPVLNHMKELPHADIIQYGVQLVSDIKFVALNNDFYGTSDDAIVAKQIISQMIKQRELERIEAKKQRKRRKPVQQLVMEEE